MKLKHILFEFFLKNMHKLFIIYIFTALLLSSIFWMSAQIVLADAPAVSSAVTSGAYTIVLTMTSALTGTQGDKTAFTVAGVASNPSVTAVTVSDTSVTLTLDNAIVYGDGPITVSYAHSGIDDLTDGVMPVVDFADQAVTNNVLPSGPSVSIEDGAVNFGYVSLGGVKDNSVDVQVITVSNGPANLNIETTFFTDGTNSWGLGESKGEYICQWQYSANSSDWYNFLLPDPTFYSLASNVSSTQNLYLKLTMPTQVIGNNPYSATVTILATAP